MGSVLSSVSAAGDATADGDTTNGSGNGASSSLAYRYPPKAGTNYFANHFIMGGEKFESPQPESFLFGENTDLNFLGCKPVPFPYPPPATPTEATKTLRSLVNIRRDSLHFVPVINPATGSNVGTGENAVGCDDHQGDDPGSQVDLGVDGGNEVGVNEDEDDVSDDDDTDVDETTNVRRKDKRRQARKNAMAAKVRNRKKYNVEFTFDCDVDCAITVYLFATEDITTTSANYTPVKPHYRSNTYIYTKGAGKLFSQPGFVFHPGTHAAAGQTLNAIHQETGVIPLVIQCVALSDGMGNATSTTSESHASQCHSTLAVVEATSDGMGYMLKPLKQKLFVDGLCYLLQEIYGLENKAAPYSGLGDDEDGRSDGGCYDEDIDDSGADCVVCMCELRDTIILPCRHLCLCFACADSLRFQANNCPICRAPFRALLQIRAVQRISHTAHPALAGTEPVPQEGVPPGYTAISLVDALNGPVSTGHQHQMSYPPPVGMLQHQQQKLLPVQSTTSTTVGQQATGSNGPAASSFKRRRKSKDQRKSSAGSSGAPATTGASAGAATGSLGSTLEIVDETSGDAGGEPSHNVGSHPKVLGRGGVGDSALSVVDVVDEELAKMAVAESLTDLSDVVKGEAGLEEDEDDEAVVVSAVPNRRGHRSGGGKNSQKKFQGSRGGSGTPGSTRSSQDSASSTKRLLPKTLNQTVTVVPASGGATTPDNGTDASSIVTTTTATGAIGIEDSPLHLAAEEANTTGETSGAPHNAEIRIIPQSAATVVNVAPPTYEESC